MIRMASAVLVLLVGSALVFFAAGRAVAPNAPVVELDGADWVEALSWSFADGPFPRGWGWGDFRIAEGVLELRERSPEKAEPPDYGSAERPGTVYFLPVAHDGNFLLEAEVLWVRGDGERDAGAHLITRDRGLRLNESGMVVFAGARPAYLRHKVNGNERADRAALPAPVEYGTWHVIRLVSRKGRYAAYLDGRPIFTRSAQPARAFYAEPHVGVEDGIARFRHVKVFTSPGFRAAPADAADGSSAAAGSLLESHRPWWVRLMLYAFYAVIALVCAYMIRHYVFTWNRLFARQRRLYLDVDEADWPRVTVLVPAHDEEAVIGTILEALLRAEYPEGKLRIIPVNDRSEDRTGEIIDELARRHPRSITPYHRREGKPGKAAALRDAMPLVADEVVLVFDADYVPGRGLVKRLVAPFFDPEVGATMGRVVPHNVDRNLLTRALDLERAGGYQVDQQARMNLRLVPQYGGTVGGVRRQALESVGGWNDDSLTEDTDATMRLVLGGWKVAYQNRSECYEQVPETWPMRMRQLARWARGHNDSMARYSGGILRSRLTSFREKLDGLMLLHIYLMSVLLLMGWGLGVVLWYLGVNRPGLIIILAVTSYSTLGNFATFFEIAAASYLDGARERIRLLPFVLFGFLVSLVAVCRVTLTQPFLARSERILWHKTEHNHARPTWS
jgi:cellulose synthase/poly-beta-1,6-N-acetylglucosamine synthase-like glycosyltransferase